MKEITKCAALASTIRWLFSSLYRLLVRLFVASLELEAKKRGKIESENERKFNISKTKQLFANHAGRTSR